MSAARPYSIDPHVATLRGKKAHAARFDPDGDTTDLDRDLAAEKLAAYIRKTVAGAPPLSEAQRDRLHLLLREGDAQ